MYARQLLKAAQLVGLSQSEIARQLGVTRALISLWALNKRMVPQQYRKALVTLVSAAAQRRLTRAAQTLGAMSPPPWAMSPGGNQREVQDLKSRLLTLLDAWDAENLEAEGIGPTASIYAALEALDVYKGMEKATLRKPDNAQRLLELCAALYEYATLLTLIGPIEEITEKGTNDGNSDNPTRHPDKPEDAR